MNSRESAGNLLIVDDEAENLRILSRLLTERGYRVRCAASGGEALDCVRAAPPDLLLLDVELPDLDGYEMCARLKADATTRDVPVVFLGAVPATQQDLRGLEAGGVDCILKPFHPEEVLARVHTHLELRRLRAALEAQAAAVAHAEEGLRASQRLALVGRLAGGVAHDFNNLLTVINGYARFAMEALAEDDPIRADIAEIRKAGERATVLTRQLLAFDRKQIPRPGAVNVNDIVAAMEKMLRRVIGEDIELVITTAPDLAAIHADPGQLEHVIVNLAVNCREAMPDGGTLTIETANVIIDEDDARRRPGTMPGAYVMLRVTEDGHRMDQATSEGIVEPFSTGKEPAEVSRPELSTVYDIVRRSGGDVEVSSERGRGASFTLCFPCISQPAATEAPTPSPAAERNAETVLVVEDDDAMRALARRILSDAGYKVLTAAHPGQALLLCERTRDPIHLLLTDVVMPNLSGPELALRLSAIRPLIKVLYTSGYSDDTLSRRSVQTDSARLVAKPFDAAELTRKVRDVLERDVGGDN